MKKIITLILLFASLVIHAQQVDTVEYFFDKDPGFGQGIKLPLKGTALDTAINFTAGNLPSGVHDLFVRLKNTKNQWSTVYQSTLLITNGIAGTEKITEAEYFYDTDPGVGKGKHITLNSAAIDSNLAFTVTGLTTGPHTIYIRLKDNNNQWSTVYQSSFLLSSGSGAGKIIAGEYFFDKDPGFGKGTQITLNNTTLDSAFNFSVTGLATGVHTVYVRLKNSDNNWSFPYQGNFVLAPGIAGTPEIKSFEYFTDADKGIAKNTVLNLTEGASIDTTLSIPVADNGAQSRTLGLRVTDQTGQISSTVLNTISLCDLYKSKGGFTYAQYGNTFTLIDTTTNSPSHKIHWLANGTLIDSNYTINYNFPTNNLPGSETISELVGTGCRTDTVVQSLNMPGIESYSPYLGSYSSDFDLDLYGGGLDSNITVYLQKGDTTIYPYMKITTDGNRHLIAVFDFHKYTKTFGYPEIREYYVVHVKYSNGYEYVGETLPIAFQKQENNTTIVCGWPVLPIGYSCPLNERIRVPVNDFISPDSIPEPYFATDLVGPGSMRTGTWTDFTLNLTNTGSVVAKGIPFFIMVPAWFDVDTAAWNIINPNPGLRDSISIIVPVDTVINGVRQQYKLIAMIYPVLAPGETGQFQLRLRTNLTTPYHIFYAAQSRMFGSPMTDNYGPCWGAVFDFAIGFVPGVSCVYALGNLINDGVNAAYGESHAPSGVFGWTLSIAGTAFSCIPGGGPLEQFAAAGAKEVGFTKALLGEVEDAANVGDKGLNVISNANSAAGSSDPCSKVKQDPKDKKGSPYASFDPNNITGNSEYDTTKNYINNYSPQSYKVSFENKPTATANAQHVMVTDTLDAAKFDFKSFHFSQVFIADSIYELPSYRYQLTTDLAIKTSKSIKVRFAATFDTATGILRADFFSIDTTGHILPQSSVAGFLPPDVDGISGTAGLTYSLYIQNLGTAQTFSNKAAIYFDGNAPIATNTWNNTVDTSAPVSKILRAIPVNDTTVKLVIQGSDFGSGLKTYTLYAKSSADTVFTIKGDVWGGIDTIVFIAAKGQKFQLYTRAKDNVGNMEKKATPDITYTFEGTLPTTFISFNAAKVGDSVQVTWSTGSEINVSHYDVEKSSDATNFTVIGSVAAGGGLHSTNDYMLYDAHPSAVNYYRIREVDNDGKYTYTRVIRIDFGSTATLSVSPVPAHSYLNITGAGNFDRIEFFDVQGRVVKQFNKTSATTFNISDLSNGTYFIRFTAPNNVQTVKFIKQ